MLRFLRLMLFPFSFFYGIVIILRNKCFDWGIIKSYTFDPPVICVGNLAVGGSGKTPVTEYLVDLLGSYKIAILSRGYGRETKGFFLADDTSTAASIGDEPLQYFRKFPGITVAVCEDRVHGIRLLERDHDLIILDDAYQHRRVRAGYNILLFDYRSMFKWQWLLPSGNLREPFWGYKRADAILITKAPEIPPPSQRLEIQNMFAPSSIGFSFIRYKALTPLYAAPPATVPICSTNATVHLLTGIANTKPLLAHLEDRFKQVVQHSHGDHHRFTTSDISSLVDAYNRDPSDEKLIITTEKDAQRLLDVRIKELLLNLPVFYLPIAVEISTDDRILFNEKILNYVSNRTRNRTIY
jgi:tetraacyldisaccharide 4'-kinase